MAALIVLVSVEVPTSERAVKEIERDQHLNFAQSAIVAAPFLQSSGTSGRDAWDLMGFALHDLVANFSLEHLGQIKSEPLASLTLPLVMEGLTEKVELEVMAVTASE